MNPRSLFYGCDSFGVSTLKTFIDPMACSTRSRDISKVECKQKNPELKGNMRNHATTEKLIVPSNFESLNAKLIEWDSDPEQRLEILNKTAIEQMEILIRRGTSDRLPNDDHLKLK